MVVFGGGGRCPFSLGICDSAWEAFRHLGEGFRCIEELP